MPTLVGLEIENGNGSPSDWVNIVADDIRDGNGAGNCSPESVAFWTLGYLPKAQKGWAITTITLNSDKLSDNEIAAAVEKVGDEPTGDIEMFGVAVGRWETKEG